MTVDDGIENQAPDRPGASSAAVDRAIATTDATRERGTAAGNAALLQARARELAREAPDDVDAAGRIEVVEFLLGRERYAIESMAIREAYPLKDLTPVPCTPAFVLGIVNIRGQILTVIDMRTFFGLPAAGLTDLNKVLILRGRDGLGHEIEVGVLADVIVGARSIPLAQVQPSLPTLTGVRADYLRGVTHDGVAILDAARLLADDRLIVDEEVEA